MKLDQPGHHSHRQPAVVTRRLESRDTVVSSFHAQKKEIQSNQESYISFNDLDVYWAASNTGL